MFLQLQHIPQIPDDTTILDLRFNRIEEIPSGVFINLRFLNTLLLNNNKIKRIDSNAFEGLSELRYLYLYKNDLEVVAPNAFNGLNKLEQLFLHNNKLARLPKGLFKDLNRLQRLRLDSNAFVCDCQMMWLAQALKDKGQTQAAATCQAPANVQGKVLTSLSNEELHCRPPQFLVEPSDVEVSFGGKAYFSCKAEGNPEPEIVWFHNNQEISTNTIGDGRGRYSFLDDGTLMIENARAEHQGVYECMARNPAGETRTAAASLSYNDSPAEGVGFNQPFIRQTQPLRPFSRSDSLEFAVRPRDVTVEEGGLAQMTCVGQGNPSPLLLWGKNGVQLRSIGRVSISSNGTLSIRSVQQEDSGTYECRLRHPDGRTRLSTALLTVTFAVAPRFVERPRDHQVPLHGSVTLTCRAEGPPRPVISWYRNSVPVLPSQKVFISNEGDLAIYQFQAEDEGLYECVAENSIATVRTYARVIITSDQERQFIGDQFVDESVQEAVTAVNRAFNNTLRELFNPSRPRTPSQLLQRFRLPSSTRALEVTRSGEIYQRALDIVLRHVEESMTDGHKYNMSYWTKDGRLRYEELISPRHLAIIANLSNCAAHRTVINCTDMCYHHRYRSHDGTCNNLQHPMWGSSLSPLIRVLPPAYENGLNTPVGWMPNILHNGHKLPSSRLVSTRLAKANHITPDHQLTHMVMQWGQFIDHDLDFVPQAVSNAQFSDGRYCNETCENQSPCFPIPVPPNDPRIHRHRCIGVTRSSSMCGSGTTSVFFNKVGPREQLNQITHYIDASNVYGSSDEESAELRDFTNLDGLLRTGILMPSRKYLLPSNQHAPVDCQIDPNTDHIPCFLAGDHRSNEQLGLLSMHTLWMREHNLIAGHLKQLNAHWDGDMIYHETRKIIGAMLQHITYAHWLPKILGPIGMEKLGNYTGYDPSIDASISNAFATAAFRFGHSLVNPVIYRLNESMQPIPQGNLPLHKAFFAPFRIVEEGGIDPVIRGLFGRAAKKLRPGEVMNSELTEKLFKLAHELALDLGALNIQRGRDHGLPSYNHYREWCGLPRARSFQEFRNEIQSVDSIRTLQELYGHPDNVDLFIGGMLEDVVQGARMGPTFMCIIVDQYRRTRLGDRFWYENGGVFTPAQVAELRQASLARVICDASDGIRHVQVDPFSDSRLPFWICRV